MGKMPGRVLNPAWNDATHGMNISLQRWCYKNIHTLYSLMLKECNIVLSV